MTSVGEKEEKANTIQPPFLCFLSPSNYDDDFNGDNLLMVMNSYMQRGVDIVGDCMHKGVSVYVGDLLYERMHC